VVMSHGVKAFATLRRFVNRASRIATLKNGKYSR
jgi:hypothetical protein